MTRWLVTGGAGQLGTELTRLLAGDEAASMDRSGLDVTDAAEVEQVVAAVRPAVVINAAAYNAVDRAEMEPELAWAVNAAGPASLAAACARAGARLIHLSTDYVFDGALRRPYGEDDPPAPLSAYGRSKLAGERAVLLGHPDGGYVVRTSWVFGADSGFVGALVRWEAEGGEVRVADDQIGSPTWVLDLARALLRLAESPAPAGVYHVANQGAVSRHTWAREVFAALGADPARVVGVPASEFHSLARRPAFSALAGVRWRAAGFAPLPAWDASVRQALEAAR